MLVGMASVITLAKLKHRFLILAVLLSASALFAADKPVLKSADCLDCHTDPANKRSANGFAKSVHSSLDCVDCHDGIKEMVHDKNVPPPNCAGCHEKEQKDYATSIHGMSHSMGASGAANCWDCHGNHEILPVKNLKSPIGY